MRRRELLFFVVWVASCLLLALGLVHDSVPRSGAPAFAPVPPSACVPYYRCHLVMDPIR